MSPRAWYALAALVSVAALPVGVLLIRAAAWLVRDYRRFTAERAR
jgi:hypothetical protein